MMMIEGDNVKSVGELGDGPRVECKRKKSIKSYESETIIKSLPN